ncbi:hypothetical protein KL930_005347 [Ogataea haglerorum]|uniref:Altered inheritance of mitochondria protein 11 n=1 Tax=Ogataea haglerorum TaxID=1937702 RepID=A0AAN6D2B4_9ASCO|nr:uncharacterized protein KL911_002335 [Ogataea haglerorum]KAG7696391.1 hypothetical protein KL915_002755 [Ogataea haglerorum]KAG7696762.1 hypothetical protein KL951_003218 [Ogataea haglerorum]KAG7706794.1 hypothetical protein KL914_002678 [Ogataea haglerorum]KAG7708900.1 hypothetical protein KL950_002420 [Ogataea haglerorum]KAG7716395.1 hypothetical protein KL913_003606 [Ogataea haglerorum]
MLGLPKLNTGGVGGKSETKPEATSDAVAKYNERRFRQAALFYGCAVMTYIASKIAYRGVIARRYNPTFYQHNHVPPKFSFYRDAASAVAHASLLAVSSMAMFVTGGFWYYDISGPREFGQRMKVLLGGAEAEKELARMPVDQETNDMQSMLTSLLSGDDETAET